MGSTPQGAAVVENQTPESFAMALRILCVEDNEGDVLLLRENLRECGLEPPPSLQHVATLAEALEVLAQKSGLPDIILLDLSLPDSHGPQTYEKIHAAAPDTAITILSGNSDQHLAFALVKTGAQDYLSKDELSPGLLARSIVYAIERQRIRSELRHANEDLRLMSRELQAAEMALVQADKLESLGRLAAGVAHEVKNPLAILQMGVECLDNRADLLGPDLMDVVTDMKAAIARADTIIREMVDFARSDDFDLKPCSINEIADRAVHMVRHESVAHKIRIETDLLGPIPNILADWAKLEQVLINLMMNSIQAMGPGGLISVRTYSGRIDEMQRDEGLRILERLRLGDTVVVIEVRDQGPGIPDHLMQRVLEPFFTTKPTGEGTGLGLSVAARIVELHRGHVEFCNVDDPRGLRVRIVLKAHGDTEHDHRG